MSDFLKKLKSIFVTEEPSADTGKSQATKPSPPVKPPVVPPRPTQNNPPSPPQPPLNMGKQDRFTEVLLNAMYQASQEGFDYIEFKQALNSLASMPMDEATRFKSAYVMGQTMGTTFERLINTAHLYMDVLKNELVKFEQAVANQRAQQVGSKQNEVASLEQIIHQKSEQIKQLTQEIQQHQLQMERLKSEMEQAIAKVEQTHQEFTSSYNALIAQMQQDVSNIKMYLK